MVKNYIPPDSREVICPSCGAGIKTPPSQRSRRVRCPKCREVVVIESLAETDVEEKQSPAATSQAAADAASDRSRIEALEARVTALEVAQAGVTAAKPGAERIIEKKKLWWVETDRAQAFSPEHGRALAHNLGNVKAGEITIRTPTEDRIALEHAVWFKEIFESAGWTVHGPEEIFPGIARKGLELAVPELPVAHEAAETYLALKAAGFEAIPVLDTALASGTEAAALSLTLPPEQAA
jgi:ribosomal protein S27E